MGVEQKTHYMYSLKSSGVASKSGAIQIRPFAEPGLRNCWGGVSATSLTTGLLSLAMMTSSPSMAFCTSSEKRVLASAILNLDMAQLLTQASWSFYMTKLRLASAGLFQQKPGTTETGRNRGQTTFSGRAVCWNHGWRVDMGRAVSLEHRARARILPPVSLLHRAQSGTRGHGFPPRGLSM